jgi:hypothetical protein
MNSSLGSGVTLERWIITSIPIPLNATVTIDGIARLPIVVPDGSPAVRVYNLQSLNYGPHTMTVTLVSYDGEASHFRLDSVSVSEAQTSSPPPPPLTPSTSTAFPTTSVPPAPPGQPASKWVLVLLLFGPLLTSNQSNRVVIGAAVGGSVGGIAVVAVALWLLFRARSRKGSFSGPSSPSHHSMLIGPRESSHPLVAPMRPTAVAMPTTIMTPRAMPASPVADGLTSNGTAASFPATTPWLAAAQISHQQSPAQYPDPHTMATPPASARSASPSIRQNGQHLSDDQVDFVAGLYHAGMSPTDVVRIVDSMAREGAPSPSGAGSSVGGGQTANPPAYDFKAAP